MPKANNNKEYEIQIEIENRCNLNCLHCSSYLLRQADPAIFSEIEIESISKIFPAPLHVYFSGGEPLLNPNLNSLIRTVKHTCGHNSAGIFTCGILENGTSISMSAAKELNECGLDDCYISLYHSDPEKHDFVTNRQGSFYSTLLSIEHFLKCNIDVKVHLVINKFNYDSLDEVIKNILTLGVSHVRLLRIVKTGAAKINWNMIGVPYDIQNSVITEIISKIDQFSGAVSISGFPEKIACRPHPNAIKCQAGTHLLYITNEKKIFPCACTKSNPIFSLGDTRDIFQVQEYLRAQASISYNENCLNPLI